MALEAIKGAGMTIQGSSSSAVRKVQMQPKEQLASNEAVSKELAVKTTDIAQFGGQNRGNGGEQQELYKDKDNPQIKKMIEEKEIRRGIQDIDSLSQVLGINGVPMLLINGEPFYGRSITELQNKINSSK